MPTAKEKHQCKRIYKQYDHLIPGKYSQLVQGKLAAKGIERSLVEITNARGLKRYDLEVMLVLKRLALAEKRKLEKKLSDEW